MVAALECSESLTAVGLGCVVHYLQRSTSSDFEGVPGAAHDHELMVHRMNTILSFGIVKDPIVSYLILIYVTF